MVVEESAGCVAATDGVRRRKKTGMRIERKLCMVKIGWGVPTLVGWIPAPFDKLRTGSGQACAGMTNLGVPLERYLPALIATRFALSVSCPV